MPAIIDELYIEQGATFGKTYTLFGPEDVPIDLTGYTARGQIRNAVTGDIVATLTCSIAQNVVTIGLTAAQTGAIQVTGKKFMEYASFIFDVELDDGAGYVSRLANGVAKVSPEVTK